MVRKKMAVCSLLFVGTFEHELDHALRVIGFNHCDEYSTAREELRRATGKDSALVRASLSFE